MRWHGGAKAARAWAKLPDDAVTTPLAASSAGSRKTAFIAPRIYGSARCGGRPAAGGRPRCTLNDPARWKFSHLNHGLAPPSRGTCRGGCGGGNGSGGGGVGGGGAIPSY